MGSKTNADPHAASAARRARLKALDARHMPSVLNTFPIEKYYAMADRLLVTFLQAVDERRLDDAYILGLRFANFSVECIPRHRHYKTSKTQRKKNALNVEKVLEKMEQLVSRMDAEELREERRRKEALQQQQHRQEKERKEAQRKKKEKPTAKKHAEILLQQRREFEAQQQQQQKLKAVEDKRQARKRMEESAKEKLKLLQLQPNKRKESIQADEVKSTVEQVVVNETADQSHETVAESAGSVASGVMSIFNAFRSSSDNNLDAKVVGSNQQSETKPAPNSRLIKCEPPGQKTQAASTKATVEPVTVDEDLYELRLTKSEAQTMHKLKEAVLLQEERLQELECSNEISNLRQVAKQKLQSGDKKGALSCLAKRRRLCQNVDIIKTSIFNMETQMMMLESAVEDREINKVMKEASDAMSGLERMTGAGQLIQELGEGQLLPATATYNDFDEEELLSEILGGEETIDHADTQSLISLPSIPSNSLSEKSPEHAAESPTALLA